MRTRSTLNALQTVAVIDLLRKHCRQDPSGRAVYEADWSDARVLQETEKTHPSQPGKTLSDRSVARYRSDMYGRIRTPRAATMATKDKLEQLTNDHNELVDGYNRLLIVVRTLVDWKRHTEEWMQRRGYVPPQGRPQAAPPMPEDGRLV